MAVGDDKDKKFNPAAQLNNVQKSALILIAMGTENAANVLRHLNDKEVEKVSIEIAKLDDVPADVLNAVIEEYYEMILANSYIVQGGMGYARKVLEQAWGLKKAEEILNRVEASTQVSAFYMLRTVDDKQLLNFLQNEHPQTAALILANLKPAQAAAILNELPPEIQGDIVFRLASMEKTSPELIADIESVLKDQMGAAFGGDLSATGGAEAVAEILNSTSRAAEKNILEQLKTQDPKLAEEIASLMFLFEDIIHLPDSAIQLINKDINNKTLALALKAVGADLKDKFMRNMSERASEMLKEEIEYLGPVRVRDVDNAQSEILEIVRRLEESGDISLGRGAEEEIIE